MWQNPRHLSATSTATTHRRLICLVGLAFAIGTFLYVALPAQRLNVSPFFSTPFDKPHEQWAPASLATTKSKYAYVTLLAIDESRDEHGDIYQDEHFVGIRILAYQLLHAAETRSAGIPFIVLAVEGTVESKKERLRKDGAIVLDIERVEFPVWMPNDNPAWANMFDKLRIWELTQFERVVYLDADNVLAKPLDSVFGSVTLQQTAPDRTKVHAERPPLPSEYIFTAPMEMQIEHHYPPARENGDFDLTMINAGFFVTKPSLSMRDYYLSVLSTPYAFRETYREQDLLNTVHSRHGRMPWEQLDPKWNIHYSTLEDLEGGLHSMHAKWWDPKHEDLSKWLQSKRWRMEGFFEARDAQNEKGV